MAPLHPLSDSESPPPSRDSSRSHETSLYERFISRALTVRLDISTFESHISVLQSKHTISATRLSLLLLWPTPNNNYCLDPRIPGYVQVCLGLGLVNVTSVLRALARCSTVRDAATPEHGEQSRSRARESSVQADEQNRSKTARNKMGDTPHSKRWVNSYAAEEIIFYRLAKHLSSRAAHFNLPDAIDLVTACVQWMGLVVSARNATVHELLTLSSSQAVELTSQTIALGTLFVAVIDNPLVVRMLEKPKLGKEPRAQLAKALPEFTALLAQSSPQTARRLEAFLLQSLAQLEPLGLKGKGAATVDNEIDAMLGGGGLILAGVDAGADVVDLPTVRSRAGLYIYLNSLLTAQPLVNDHAILAYLHNRYEGDIATTSIDLILASFDILANATFRNEKPQAITILRSFLINKVPLLLVNLSSSMFPPLTPEYCITEALGQVDTTAFPTLSNLFDDSNIFSDSVRQDFCFACCLHDLLSESSIENLLGDVPMQSLPTSGRYSRDELVQQCLSDPEKAEGLIDELEHMDGNVGAVSQAITDVVGRLCASRETMSLKTLCNRISRKPLSLDIMLLFSSATAVLQPLCALLDNWRYDEDQGEYQPVYEEFGSILLLVLSFIHRYNIPVASLGVRTSNSFVIRLLTQGNPSRAMETLSDSEQSHLDGWIRGLFDPDSGGLGDELMSACPPQDFYLLVPTLFHHIVLAYSTNNLSDESLKYGLEFLADIFLLPALIPGITWLSSHLWESRGDANAVLNILSSLIASPSTISSTTEAPYMLNAVLNVVARTLEHSLRWLQRAEPSREDIEPLLRVLKGDLAWDRRGTSDATELEAWTSHAGGLAGSLRSTFGALVSWASHPSQTIGGTPPSYTHRHFLVARKMMGARRVLNILAEEIKAHTQASRGSAALDVATAIVCAPDRESWDVGSGGTMDGLDGIGAGMDEMLRAQRRLTLREVLKVECDNLSVNAQKLQAGGGAEGIDKEKGKEKGTEELDQGRIDALVQLGRRVNTQMVVHGPLAGIPMSMDLGMETVGVDVANEDGHVHNGLQMEELDEAAAAAAAELDVGMGGLDGMGSMDGMGGMGGDDLGDLSMGMDIGDDLLGSMGWTG